MLTPIRLSARQMIAFRAGEAVVQRFTADPEAHWIHAEVLTTAAVFDGFQVKGLAWCPKASVIERVTIAFSVMELRGRWALVGANIFNDPVSTSDFYYFSYDDEDLKDLRRFCKGKPKEKILPGFTTRVVTKIVEVE